MKPNYFKELFYLFAWLALNAFFLYVAVSIKRIISAVTSVPHWFGIMAVITGCIVLSYLADRRQPKKSNPLTFAIAFPYRILRILVVSGVPFLLLQIHIVLYLAICVGFPVLMILAYEHYTGLVVLDALRAYIILTTSVVSLIIFQKQIIWIVHFFSPGRITTSRRLKAYNLFELSNYMLSEINLRFVVFLLYFIILVMINAINLRGLGFPHTPEIDDAVLQSFATFLAFERIVNTLKVMEFKPSEMIAKMRTAIRDKFNDLDSHSGRQE